MIIQEIVEIAVESPSTWEQVLTYLPLISFAVVFFFIPFFNRIKRIEQSIGVLRERDKSDQSAVEIRLGKLEKEIAEKRAEVIADATKQLNELSQRVTYVEAKIKNGHK